MNENITKPITIAKEDFSKNVVDLINNSHLPFFVIEYLLKDLIEDVKKASVKQLEADILEYNNLLNDNKDEHDTSETV